MRPRHHGGVSSQGLHPPRCDAFPVRAVCSVSNRTLFKHTDVTASTPSHLWRLFQVFLSPNVNIPRQRIIFYVETLQKVFIVWICFSTRRRRTTFSIVSVLPHEPLASPGSIEGRDVFWLFWLRCCCVRSAGLWRVHKRTGVEPGSERGDAVQIPSIRLIKMFLWICCGLIHSEALTLPPSGRGVVLPAVSFLNLFFNQIFEILIKIIYIYI